MWWYVVWFQLCRKYFLAPQILFPFTSLFPLSYVHYFSLTWIFWDVPIVYTLFFPTYWFGNDISYSLVTVAKAFSPRLAQTPRELICNILWSNRTTKHSSQNGSWPRQTANSVEVLVPIIYCQRQWHTDL